MSGVSVGDTIYLDQYYNESTEQNVTKRVVIIGTGYDTELTDEKVVATLTGGLNLRANFVAFKSCRLDCTVNLYATDCTIARCLINNVIKTQSTTAGINHIYSCYIFNNGRIEGYSSDSPSKFDVQNSIIINNNYADNPNIHNIAYLTESIINNNVIIKNFNTPSGSSTYTTRSLDQCYCMSNISNTRITNNLIYGYDSNSSYYYNRDFSNDVIASGSGNTIEHNVFSGTASLQYFPTNKIGQRDNWESFFVCEGGYSDYYRLSMDAGDNPCINYATDGGEVGCHGGMFGCPAGGRPQYIPYFTKVTVGSRAENGKLPVSVSIKIQEE